MVAKVLGSADLEVEGKNVSGLALAVRLLVRELAGQCKVDTVQESWTGWTL